MSELENQCRQHSAWILTKLIVDLDFEIRIKVVAPDVSFLVVLESMNPRSTAPGMGIRRYTGQKSENAVRCSRRFIVLSIFWEEPGLEDT